GGGGEIVNTLATAPLTDLLLTARGDWRVSDADTMMFRYSLDRSEDTGGSTLIRSIGSASERQTSQNHYQAFTTAWTRVITANVLNRFTFAENNFDNNIQPVSPGPQLTFPSIQDGSSFRVPQGTRQNRLEFSDTLSWVKGKHSFKFGGDFQ